MADLLEPPAGALPLASPQAPSKVPYRLPLVDQYLREQGTMTAVDKFAQREAAGLSADHERYYRDLLPRSKPSAGEQYAFQVDLDICTGCKACVTACHNLNGLDEGETWRAVGLLHGGSSAAPVQQSVTTACHHCLDPACMNGCPVGAYEKDALTGIVKHLDDQCIGCQYCTFTCPYDVPQYNASLGIVRKCDMCTDRLAVGEAPACVQACPNEAIAITIVQKRQVLEDAQGDSFLPGAPSPGITAPTTVYKTARALPRNLLPANFYKVSPSPHHTPLVTMLVLTQLSVGAFATEAVVRRILPLDVARSLGPTHALVALVVALVALASSVLHLGRPLYAFRAFIGLRTSWMSREIIAFGAYAPLAILYAAAALFRPQLEALSSRLALTPELLPRMESALGSAVWATGAIGVFCSIAIYHVTRRAFWTASYTGFKFVLTAVVLGLATTLVTLSLSASLGAGEADVAREPLAALARGLLAALALASGLKAAGELSFFLTLREKRHTDSKRSALLMVRDLARYTAARFAALLVGGLVLPLVHGDAPLARAPVVASFVLLLIGELFERTLFFAAASPKGMPGGVS